MTPQNASTHRMHLPPGGFAAISKYNPHLWTPEQLRAIFVARQRELADLTQTLSTQPDTEVAQHCLLVGARGMGKSTLMQRLALAVEDSPELHAAWLPLRFPEEQYTVNTLAQFWANVLDSLADALERRGEPTDTIDTTAVRLSALPPAEQAEAMLKAIVDISQQRKQRLLLLVDNTDLLLSNIGPRAQWALRQVLQTEPRLMWVGGSYQSLEANSQYHDAFLDFFRVLELRPLSLAEMQEALLALATTVGGDAARDHLTRQLKQQPERLPTLRLLSGGNPRTTVMLYELLASGQAGHVRSDLEALLDSMTPLYKARLDALADLPRKLLAHILGHWAPISLAQLAEASQVAKTSISPQLQRLEQEGLIQKTKLHGTTRSGYQAAERFFNIWYLMRLSPRRQRTRLSWLVEFMRLWFSSDELCHLARTRLTRESAPTAHEWDYDSALADALPTDASEKHGLRWNLLKQLQTQREALLQVFDFDGADRDYKGAEDYLRRARTLPDQLRRCPHAKTGEDKQRWVAAVMGAINLSLKDKSLIATTSSAINTETFETIRDQLHTIAELWIELSSVKAFKSIQKSILSLDFFPDFPDSKLAFKQIQHCFANHPEALKLASHLHSEAHKDEWTLKTLELAQRHLPKDALLAHQIGWLWQERLGNPEKAEQAYRQAIALNDQNAFHWNALGTLLKDQQHRFAEAEQAYRQAIALNNQNAGPWYNLGILLQHRLRRYEEAEQAYRKAITLDSSFASPWNGLGNLLQDHLGRYDESEQAYRRAIALDNHVADPWNNLARLLKNHLNRYAEAEQAYRQSIALNEKFATPWYGLGNLLQDHLGRYDEAEQAYTQAIAIDSKSASTWNGLGNLLQDHLNRLEEAEQAYRKALELEDDPLPRSNLARLLWTTGRTTEATEQYVRGSQAIQAPDFVRLQAHLVLNNQQLALDALNRLAQEAEQGSSWAAYCLREQVWECTALGLGERLADWMQLSPHALYLQPMIQALYTLAGAQAKLQDLPVEVQQMADAVVDATQRQLRRT